MHCRDTPKTESQKKFCPAPLVAHKSENHRVDDESEGDEPLTYVATYCHSGIYFEREGESPREGGNGPFQRQGCPQQPCAAMVCELRKALIGRGAGGPAVLMCGGS